MCSPTVICLTPVRNEAWVLDRFLKAASLWADIIIIADQNSTDGSVEIAKRYSKVRIIKNNNDCFNENERQKLLINAAREIEGNRLLVTLDADEMFSPELYIGEEWGKILTSSPGTIFRFQWASFLPGLNKYWLGYHFPWAYMDDGEEHNDTRYMHSTRIPMPDNHPIVDIDEIKVIHYQYTDPLRNASKQRWYQCLELDNPTLAKDPIGIYRKYHQSESLSESRIFPIPNWWRNYYSKKNINIDSVDIEGEYWYDSEVRNLIKSNGAAYYKKLNIWTDVFKDIDPRGPIDKVVHFWLRKSQPHYFSKARKIDDFLRRILKY